MTDYFPAKVMLFGEYSVLYGSRALTIPYPRFSARLALPHGNMNPKQHQGAKNSNRKLQDFYGYLLESKRHSGFDYNHILDLKALKDNLKEGLFLSSNIPSGYGLGSSGVLVAAVFHQFAQPHVRNESLPGLQQIFARMEGYFHHSSSGLDPLSSYVRQPLITGGEPCHTIAIPPMEKKGTFFLLDSKQSRNTGKLVKAFREKNADAGFRQSMQETYAPVSEACIEALLSSENAVNTRVSKLHQCFRQLSQVQRSMFADLIPASMTNLWDAGLSGNTFALKLCGAGGGGFLLGFTQSLPETKKALQAFSPIVLELPQSG